LISFNPSQADYESKKFPPGVYTITIKGEVNDSGNSQDTTFTLTLVDVCDPPTSVTAATLIDQVYTVTDTTHPDFTHAAFATVPAYCPVTYAY